MLGSTSQSVAHLTADAGVASLKLSITFIEMDLEIISVVFLPFCRFRKGSCQLLVKVYSQVLLNCLED